MARAFFDFGPAHEGIIAQLNLVCQRDLGAGHARALFTPIDARAGEKVASPAQISHRIR
jgi:hypothetical protein